MICEFIAQSYTILLIGQFANTFLTLESAMGYSGGLMAKKEMSQDRNWREVF